jgi:hypothetical protein
MNIKFEAVENHNPYDQRIVFNVEVTIDNRKIKYTEMISKEMLIHLGVIDYFLKNFCEHVKSQINLKTQPGIKTGTKSIINLRKTE